MFTGIIESTGQVSGIKKGLLTIQVPTLVKELKIGSSIAVDGVCLTVRKKTGDAFEADVMPVTLERTNLGHKKKGDQVNLELAMLGSKRFEGHIVAGHVEGVAELATARIVDNAYELKFRLPGELCKYVVQTGSIALNGISLTVMDIEKDLLTVSIIPHTWENTNLHSLKTGDKVNVETDILAKYAEKLGLKTKN